LWRDRTGGKIMGDRSFGGEIAPAEKYEAIACIGKISVAKNRKLL